MTDATAIWTSERYTHPAAWAQDYPPLSLSAMFDASAARLGEAPLIDFMGRKYSYAETADGVRRVAHGLRALGIGAGDRVGLYLPNVPHYVAAYYGALRIGAIVVNFSPLYSVEELAAQVADSGTRILFTLSASALLPNALQVLERTGVERLVVGSVAGALPPVKSILYRLLRRRDIAAKPDDPRILPFSRLIANDGSGDPAPIDAERDLALLQYTGGTTGTPKGAMLTHQNLSANARQVDALDPWRDAEDRIVGALPLFHIFANTCILNRTVLRGGEMVLLPRFDAGQVLATVQRVKATALPGVPAMYLALLDHADIGRTDFGSLRICISGGAPMPLEVRERFEARTGARLVEGYGLTESSGVVSANPYEGLNKAGTVGQPIPATRIVLVDKEDPSRPPPPGQPGEVTIAGPQVMKGYWNRPDADAVTFVDGRLRTGDIGLIDEDGYLSIVDRLKDMINVSGFKVFPSQIENVLYRHPAVKEALVIAIPDPLSGERPKAFVALHGDATASAEELTAFVHEHVGKHERLAGLEIREALPKTMVGKLSRKELVAEEQARAEQQRSA
jgi:long-chain acyl-CoA synthetase